VFLWLHIQSLVALVSVLIPEDDTEMSKLDGVNIIQRDSVVIHICALVG